MGYGVWALATAPMQAQLTACSLQQESMMSSMVSLEVLCRCLTRIKKIHSKQLEEESTDGCSLPICLIEMSGDIRNSLNKNTNGATSVLDEFDKSMDFRWGNPNATFIDTSLLSRNRVRLDCRRNTWDVVYSILNIMAWNS